MTPTRHTVVIRCTDRDMFLDHINAETAAKEADGWQIARERLSGDGSMFVAQLEFVKEVTG